MDVPGIPEITPLPDGLWNKKSSLKNATTFLTTTGIEKNTMDTAEGMIRVTLSLGVAAYGARGMHHDMNDLVKRADGALYAAKKNGLNRVEIALD